MSLLHLPKYIEKKEEVIVKEKSVSAGFLKFLTDVNKLKLLCFLTDLGYIYGRFQKQIQSDETLIFDVEDKSDGAIHIISLMKESPLVRDWEDTIINTTDGSYISNNEKDTTTYMLKGFQLFDYV
ncbi:hypothetical protein QTP88_019347 [Uroleucon formosanum]